MDPSFQQSVELPGHPKVPSRLARLDLSLLLKSCAQLNSSQLGFLKKETAAEFVCFCSLEHHEGSPIFSGNNRYFLVHIHHGQIRKINRFMAR